MMLTGLLYYIYIYICVSYVVPHILNLSNLTYERLYNTYSANAMCSTWSRTAILQQESPSHQGTEKTDCSVEESERELVVPLKPRNRERNG